MLGGLTVVALCVDISNLGGKRDAMSYINPTVSPVLA
jgi:hypothetical protein